MTTVGGSDGWGTVYEVTGDGTEKVLHSFRNVDGATPFDNVIRDASGNLYGTTSAGGDLRCGAYGCGVVFKIDTTGKETVLYTFRGGTDGCFPYKRARADVSFRLFWFRNKMLLCRTLLLDKAEFRGSGWL